MDIGVKMTENAGIDAGSGQENSEKSEIIQQESEINTENTNDSPSDDTETPSEGEKAPSSEGDDGELALPEPDVAEEEGKKKKELPEWMKKKVDREKRKEAEKEQAITAEAARLREENLRLRAGVQPPQAPQNPQAPVDPYMPQREQFNNESEYFLALTDYREVRRSQEIQFHQRQKQIKEHEEKFQGGLKDAIETGKNKYKDFEERTDYILYGDGFPSNRAMAEAIVESSYKDDILYFLGTHVKEAERIASLNPVSAAKEIAKIEVRFDSRKKSNITKAPAPLKPLGGGNSGGSATHGDPNKMGMDDFRQWYEDKYGRR